jgi:hypothetical protein
MSLFQASQQWSTISSYDLKTRFDSQLSRKNCQTFSAGLSSGHFAGKGAMVMLGGMTSLSVIHHGVSAKHLQAYLNEFTFRFNRRFYPFNAFRSLLGIAGEVAAPTFGALYSGEGRHPIYSGCMS